MLSPVRTAQRDAIQREIDVLAPNAGFISHFQTDEIGRAAMMLGAGRQRVDDGSRRPPRLLVGAEEHQQVAIARTRGAAADGGVEEAKPESAEAVSCNWRHRGGEVRGGSERESEGSDNLGRW